jgi:hypothetical protein
MMLPAEGTGESTGASFHQESARVKRFEQQVDRSRAELPLLNSAAKPAGKG